MGFNSGFKVLTRVTNIRAEVSTLVLPTTKQESCPLGVDETEVGNEKTFFSVM